MRMVAGIMGVVLAGWLAEAGTELTQGAQVVFQASGNVTFGAAYSERAVKATVVSPTPVTVSVQTGRKPVALFLAEARLAADAWSFDAGKGTVIVALPAGTADLQLRFDDLADLKPFQVRLPVVLAGAEMGQVDLTVAAEKVLGTWSWPGPEGMFEIRAVKGTAVAPGVRVEAPIRGGDGALFLQTGTALSVQGEAPAQKAPLDRLECRLLAAVTPSQRVPKDTLPWAGSVVLEGENFKAEGGGAVSRSTEHGNTHGGGCIYAWGAAGHWITWEAAVPTAGDYVLTLVLASQESAVLRALAIDGQPAAGAAMLRLAGTGGWGRANPDEWQALQPVDAQGQPVRFRLTAGTHEIRLENVLGQHANVDCLLLTPAP